MKPVFRRAYRCFGRRCQDTYKLSKRSFSFIYYGHHPSAKKDEKQSLAGKWKKKYLLPFLCRATKLFFLHSIHRYRLKKETSVKRQSKWYNTKSLHVCNTCQFYTELKSNAGLIRSIKSKIKPYVKP